MSCNPGARQHINVALRFFLLSGLYTGSVYYDSKANEILTGSKVCPIGNVLIVKTHSLGNGLRRLKCGEIQTLDYRKAVYIVRNPYNAILAEFNREQGGKVATVTRETFSTQGTCSYIIRTEYHVSVFKSLSLSTVLGVL